MRYAAILALSLSMGFALEDQQTEPEAQLQDAAVAEAAKPYEELMQAHTALLQELAACLAGVVDEATAREAAPKVAALQGRIPALFKQEKATIALGEPTEEVRTYIERRYKTEGFEQLVKDSIGRGLELLGTLPACYGATTLETALTNLFDLYLGGNAEEEEG